MWVVAMCLCGGGGQRLLDALVAEAAEVEDVAEEEADERGGAEDVGRDERERNIAQEPDTQRSTNARRNLPVAFSARR